MYSMHKYWSKKSPDEIAAYIERYTNEGDIILDPFCGSGIVACEAVRLNRRAFVIDLNPIATFITRVTLTPVNLSRLQWAFQDLKSTCEEPVSGLFKTTCNRCGKNAVIEFVVRSGDIPIQIAYSCTCSDIRLFKAPNTKDKDAGQIFKRTKIPYWFPDSTPIPLIQKERFQYIHELFTRRNLIALSTILNEIEKIDNLKVRDVFKLVFTGALAQSSRLKPLSGRDRKRPTLSEGWVAVRYYAPKMWQEVNPWFAFERSFERVYKGKKESNDKLKNVAIGASYEDLSKEKANVLIFTGSSDTIIKEKLPDQCVDYVLTDPPFGKHIQYLSLSTFWGAWLKFDFNYNKELVVNPHRSIYIEDYERLLGDILKETRRVIKPHKYLHIYYHDIHGPYLHKMLSLVAESKFLPERIIHQPPPNSFGAAIRNLKKEQDQNGKYKRGHYGSYIVRCRAEDEPITLTKNTSTEKHLSQKIAEIAKETLAIRKGIMPVGTLLHSIYQKLNSKEIICFAPYSAEKYVQEAIKNFAFIRGDTLQLTRPSKSLLNLNRIKIEKVRKTLLDAQSLYINEKEKEHQIYQRVLRRLEGNGITFDYLVKMKEGITEPEVQKHRKQRISHLLFVLGQNLKFISRMLNGKDTDVLWKYRKKVTIAFRVTDRNVLVKAYQYTPRGAKQSPSEVGIITDVDLENAIYKWCINHPNLGSNILKYLNPMGYFPSDSNHKAPKHLLLKVLENEKLCPGHYLLTLQYPGYKEPQPGQFFHLVCDTNEKDIVNDTGTANNYQLTLRRPFSVHRIYYKNFDRRILATRKIIPYEIKNVIKRPIYKIDILYKVVGTGTKSLSEIRPRTYLDAIGPIGKGFPIEEVETAIIVAGGIGVAPLVALAERLRYLGSDIILYFGALKKEILIPILGTRPDSAIRGLLRTRPDSTIEDGFMNGSEDFLQSIQKEFKEIGAKKITVCTDDESIGKKGLVSEILEKDINLDKLPSKNVTIYACGPAKMLEAVSNIAKDHSIPCYVLLEERMACGIGACFSCTCRVHGKSGEIERKRVCVDGPVFNSEEIAW